MRNFSFTNERYSDMLTKQTLHMDQGACYNPEYLGTRNMHSYPSRVAQIIRAVYLNEMEASEYGGEIVFTSILSGLGERWQNFGENPNHYLFCMLLGRELFVQKNATPKRLATGFFDVEISEKSKKKWEEALHCDPSSSTLLFTDNASFEYCSGSARKLAGFLTANNVSIKEYGPFSTTFSLFANGRIDAGIQELEKLFHAFTAKGIRRVITVSGAGHYLLTVLAPELGIIPASEIEIINLLDLAYTLKTEKAYVHGGSFYQRYLGMGPLLEALSANLEEESIPNCPEFEPILRGDARVNRCNIWAKPLCAEFAHPGTDPAIAEVIYTAGIESIKKTSYSQIVMCEPFAYHMLQTKGEGKVLYFWDVLE